MKIDTETVKQWVSACMVLEVFILKNKINNLHFLFRHFRGTVEQLYKKAFTSWPSSLNSQEFKILEKMNATYNQSLKIKTLRICSKIIKLVMNR